MPGSEVGYMGDKIQSTLVNTIPLWKSQKVSREKRKAAEAELMQIENDMRQKLLEMSR